MRAAPTSSEAGFSLIELLVSLALLALLMAMVPGTLTLARRETQVAVELDRRASFDAAMSFLEQQLAQATAIYERGEDGRLRIIFSGEADAVTFMAPSSVRALEAGLARFELKIGGDGDGRTGLIVSWMPWRPAPAEGETVTGPPPRSRLIVPDAQNLTLRYLGPGSDGEAPVWSPTWARTDAIPDLVEIKVTSGRQTKIRSVALRLKTP